MDIQNRINDALSRVTNGRSLMCIPPSQSDVDLVLSDCAQIISDMTAAIEAMIIDYNAAHEVMPAYYQAKAVLDRLNFNQEQTK